MDNDAKMLERMGIALTDLVVQYRKSPLSERVRLKPLLEELIRDYGSYQVRLIKEGVITVDSDLQAMEQIANEIKAAADAEAFLKAVARTVAFVATKV